MYALSPPISDLPMRGPSMLTASGKAMKKYSGNGRTGSEERANEFRDRLVTFLRRRHPHKTAAAVAADTGIEAATVRKWLETGNIVPSGGAVFRLILAYGPEFLCAVTPTAPAWLQRAAKTEEQERAKRVIEAADLRTGESAHAELQTLEARLSRIEAALQAVDPDFFGAEIDALRRASRARGQDHDLDRKARALALPSRQEGDG